MIIVLVLLGTTASLPLSPASINKAASTTEQIEE